MEFWVTAVCEAIESSALLQPHDAFTDPNFDIPASLWKFCEAGHPNGLSLIIIFRAEALGHEMSAPPASLNSMTPAPPSTLVAEVHIWTALGHHQNRPT